MDEDTPLRASLGRSGSVAPLSLTKVGARWRCFCCFLRCRRCPEYCHRRGIALWSDCFIFGFTGHGAPDGLCAQHCESDPFGTVSESDPYGTVSPCTGEETLKFSFERHHELITAASNQVAVLISYKRHRHLPYLSLRLPPLSLLTPSLLSVLLSPLPLTLLGRSSLCPRREPLDGPRFSASGSGRPGGVATAPSSSWRFWPPLSVASVCC